MSTDRFLQDGLSTMLRIRVYAVEIDAKKVSNKMLQLHKNIDTYRKITLDLAMVGSLRILE
jgi:hypothetical protein